MRPLKRFATNHQDIIHDLSYDFYGKRLATCSSDQKIKVFDLEVKDRVEQWILTCEWKAHNGSIWKVQWAHPEFGQVLASCSYDRSVRIWEEQEGNNGTIIWITRAILSDSVRSSVQDIKFSPKHLGLRLATGSKDGIIRIYEAIDITNLAHWHITEQWQSQQEGINSIAWNLSPFDAPMLVVASDDCNARVWEYNENLKSWQITCQLIGHTQGILHIAWAPNMGHVNHTVATAGKDHTVRIWTLKIDRTEGKTECKQVAVFDHHKAPVWRVEWNITGTILASSGDDGVVRLWKKDFAGEWKNMVEVSSDTT